MAEAVVRRGDFREREVEYELRRDTFVGQPQRCGMAGMMLKGICVSGDALHGTRPRKFQSVYLDQTILVDVPFVTEGRTSECSVLTML
jgi:hypothetical protein